MTSNLQNRLNVLQLITISRQIAPLGNHTHDEFNPKVVKNFKLTSQRQKWQIKSVILCRPKLNQPFLLSNYLKEIECKKYFLNFDILTLKPLARLFVKKFEWGEIFWKQKLLERKFLILPSAASRGVGQFTNFLAAKSSVTRSGFLKGLSNFLNGPIPASFSFIFVFSIKPFNFYNK